MPWVWFGPETLHFWQACRQPQICWSVNHALSNKGFNPLEFFLLWGKRIGGCWWNEGINQVCDLWRAPEKKISHHPCPGCICLTDYLKFGVSVQLFLDVGSQVTPSERECWATPYTAWGHFEQSQKSFFNFCNLGDCHITPQLIELVVTLNILVSI